MICLNPLESGQSFQLLVKGLWSCVNYVSIPSNRGSLSNKDYNVITSGRTLSLNPLESGQSFQQINEVEEQDMLEVSIPSNRGSLSNQIHNMAEVMLSSVSIPSNRGSLSNHLSAPVDAFGYVSQSPRIGAVFPTIYTRWEDWKMEVSLNPLESGQSFQHQLR